MNHITFYNRFALLYPLVEVFVGKHKKRLAQLVNTCPGTQLLEIGVGTGTALKYYKDKTITGIDTSVAMLKAARKRNPGVRLLEMDAANTSFGNNTFDNIVISHVLAVTPDADRVIAEAYRILKPGGNLFILNHFTPDNLLGVLDKAISPVSRLLAVRSYFPLSALDLDKFAFVNKTACDTAAYYKILILQKP